MEVGEEGAVLPRAVSPNPRIRMEERVTPVVELFRELRRRKVLHVAAVYLGGAIVGLDAVNNAMDAYGLPTGLQQAFGLMVVIGFPAAVLTSWWYDWTGEGIRRVEAERPPPPVHRLAMASAATLVVLSGLAGALVVVRARTAPDSPGTASATPEAPDRVPSSPMEAGTVLGVLPVEHAGVGESWAWLPSALEARLEGALADIPAFRVVHRRSLEGFREPNTPLDSLARRFDIDYFISAQFTGISDGGATVLVELLNGETTELVTSDEIPVRLNNLHSALDTLVLRIEEVLRPALGHEIRLRQWRAGTRDTVALRRRYQAAQRFSAARELAGYDPAAAEREFAAADSILDRVSDRDPGWIEPHLARARLADRWALTRLMRGNRPGAAASYDRGIERADAALNLDTQHAEALALRGYLRWRKAVLAWTGNEEGRATLVDEAEGDLRDALNRDPGQVIANAGLSEILFRERHSYAEARQLALEAYTQDAYLDRAGESINRIALSALEVGEDEEAMAWSELGLRRDPGALSHLSAVLDIMAWGDVEPDPDRAWRHLQTIAGVQPAMGQYYTFDMAAILARAGLVDSARAVLERNRASLDPAAREAFMELEAAALFRIGDTAEARSVFRSYAETAPVEARQMASRRMLRDYVDVPE